MGHIINRVNSFGILKYGNFGSFHVPPKPRRFTSIFQQLCRKYYSALELTLSKTSVLWCCGTYLPDREDKIMASFPNQLVELRRPWHVEMPAGRLLHQVRRYMSNLSLHPPISSEQGCEGRFQCLLDTGDCSAFSHNITSMQT